MELVQPPTAFDAGPQIAQDQQGQQMAKQRATSNALRSGQPLPQPQPLRQMIMGQGQPPPQQPEPQPDY